ncbi:hypothetical protein BSKO_04498 [Bryopsis sp. KO-2023]|nr:hypothetical protein BSKO_04498 [Bryopsis sp. KO-2023]
MKGIMRVSLALFLALIVFVDGGAEVGSFEAVPDAAKDGTKTGLKAALDFISTLFAPPEFEPPLISEAVNWFGFSLVNEFRALNPDASIVFSPVSLSGALSLLYFGSHGATKADMEIALGFTAGVVPDQLRAKANAIDRNRKSTAIANRAYFAKGMNIKDSFVDAVGQVNVGTLDFSKDLSGAIKTINGFVSDTTRGLIPDMMAEGDVTAATRMVLVNAVYFKGTWKTVFDKDKTFKGEFQGVDGPVEVDMMKFEAGEVDLWGKDMPDLEAEVLEFPYDDDRFAMYIVLPYEADGWRFVEEQLAEVDADFFKTDLEPQSPRIEMPKWEQEVTLEGVRDMLEFLGLKSVFSGADFSGITEGEDVTVSDIVHKAVIRVSEEGTEAGAVTGGAGLRSLYEDEFLVSHPFLYFVVDATDDTVFFQGTVTKI